MKKIFIATVALLVFATAYGQIAIEKPKCGFSTADVITITSHDFGQVSANLPYVHYLILV